MNRTLLSYRLLCLYALLVCSTTFVQRTYAQTSSPTLNPVGSTYPYGPGTGPYDITPASGSGCMFQYGALWSQTTVDFTRPFQINFDASFDGGPGSADGIAVVFGQFPDTSSPVSDGGSLGYYSSVSTSHFLTHTFDIEMDIFDNGRPTYNDTTYDHLGIGFDGNFPTAWPPPMIDTSTDITDGVLRHYQVVWDPVTKTLLFYTNCRLRMTSLYDYSSQFSTPTAVTWGFTGSTGHNCSHQVVENVSVTTLAIDTVSISRCASSITLSAPNPPDTWSWATGAATDSITVDSNGIYSVFSYGDTFCTVSENAYNIHFNPASPLISGTTYACAGSTALLVASRTTGGRWTSEHTSIATIGTYTGFVTGVSSGVDTMTFTDTATLCTATSSFTVNVTPTAITGSDAMCIGASSHLTDAIPGGTWSSHTTSIATVTSTGIVTGVSLGTSIISYVLPDDCYITTTVTINTLGSPILGGLDICTGSATTLSDAAGAGVWVASPATVATIGSSSGVITGVSIGTASVTYTYGSCYATATVTVNPTPTAITGGGNVCIGSSRTLADLTGGGTWSSSNTSIATVSSSAVVTGIAAGVAIITYQMPTGCYVTQAVTVNPFPAALPVLNICPGNTVTLTDSSGSGMWTSANPRIASVGFTSGIVTGDSIGTTTITFTLGSTGCRTTTSVNVMGTPDIIWGTHGICPGVTSEMLADSTHSMIWSSSNTAIVTITPEDPTHALLNVVNYGIATISYTLASTGCASVFTVTVGPGPIIKHYDSLCAYGLTDTLTDIIVGGTWSSHLVTVMNYPTFAVETSFGPGIGTVTYTLGDGCHTTTDVTVNPDPAYITGTSYVCAGDTTALVDTTLDGVWLSGSPGIATVTPSGLVVGVATGIDIITYLLPTGCISTQAVTVNPAPSPISGATVYCPGSTHTLTDLVHGGVWTSSDATVATVGSSTGLVTAVATGVATITYTMCGLDYATLTITVNFAPPPISGPTVICPGASPTYSDATPGYTWRSQNPFIATIDSTGTLTPVSTGVDIISYGYDGSCYATLTVTIDGGTASCSPCTAFGGTGYSAMPSSGSTGGNYYMSGDLNITGTVTYTNAVVYIAPGAHLYVKPRASLTLNGCHLFSCTNGMWQGIVVQSAGGYSGQVILTGNTNLIEDAVVAIDVENPAAILGTAPSPNFVDCYNAIFNRNDTAIKVKGYSPTTSAATTYPFNIEATVFTGRYLNGYAGYPLAWPDAQSLKDNSTMPSVYMAPFAVAGYPGAACHNDSAGHILTMGIYMANVGVNTYPTYGSIQVGQPQPSVSSPFAPRLFNLFDTLNYGIVAQNANLIATNNGFAHINKSAGVTGTAPATGGTGIYTVMNDGKNYALNVEETSSGSGRYADTSINSFWNCTYGVYSLNYYHIQGMKSQMVTTQSNATGISRSNYGYYVQTSVWDTINLSFNTIINTANGIAVMTPGGMWPVTGAPGQTTINNNNIRAKFNPRTTPLGNAYVEKAIWVDNTVGYVIKLSGTYTNMLNTDNNTITDAYNGIYINSAPLRVATSNGDDINLLQHPSFADTTMQYGIYHANCGGDNVYNSFVTGNNAADTGWKGIYEYSCRTPSITCNQVSEVGTGFEFEASTLNAKWEGNTMMNNQHGFVLGCVIGAQGNAAAPSDNYWKTVTGSGFTWTAPNYQTYTTHSARPSLSPLWIRAGTYTDPTDNGNFLFTDTLKYGWNGSTVTGSGNGLDVTGEYSVAYRCYPLSVITDGGNTSVAQGYLTGTITLPHHRAANYWNGQFAVWQQMATDSALADTMSIFASFDSLAASSRFAVLTWVENALASGDTSTAQYILNNYSVDSLANSSQDTTTGLQMADDTTADNIVLNYRAFYQLYINFLEGDMSSSDSSAVTGLASLCPITGGNVVFKARALYDLLNDTLALFPDNCPDSVVFDTTSVGYRMSHPAGVQAITENSDQQYTLYPNPNNGSFILKQGVQDADPVKAELMDMVGRVLFKGDLHFSDLQTQMQMYNATPGIYLLQLTDSKGQSYKFKFVVE